MLGATEEEMAMDIRMKRGFVLVALLLASLPAFGQSVRLIVGGTAYGQADEQFIRDSVIDQVVGAPANDRAQVVFFRPAETPRSVSLSEGDEVLAELPARSYSVIELAPGDHTFVVDGSSLQLRVDAGERRFIRIADEAARQRLVPSQPLTFLRASLGMRPPLI
jgi:hypothetical protein